MSFELIEIGDETTAECHACPRRARYRLYYRTRSGSTDFKVCPQHALRAAEDLYQKLQRRLYASTAGIRG